jgi:hypothetical protein
MKAKYFAGACLAIVLSVPLAADAQVPPHYPGTICFTPRFWCWMAQPGPVGGPCACPSPQGWVPGRLG